LLAKFSAGIKMAIKSAMIAITTKSSISVNPIFLRIILLFLFYAQKYSFSRATPEKLIETDALRLGLIVTVHGYFEHIGQRTQC